MNNRNQLNPTIAVLIMLLSGLILTFSQKIWLNVVVFIFCLIYLGYCRIDWKKLCIALFPIIHTLYLIS